MDKVSIIIPLYNAENYIEETLKSAINQSYSNIEIIIVDDGSEDNSANIVKNFLSENIKYVYQKNQGVSVARNTGLKLATGKYINFLDSDDIFYKDKIKLQIEMIKKSNLNAVYCRYFNWNNDTNIRSTHDMKISSGKILKYYLNETTIPQTCTWLIEKRILDEYKILFTEGCSWGEDLEFLSKMLLYSEVDGIEKELVDYRIDSNGSLSDIYKLTYEDLIMWERLKEWLAKQKISKKEKEVYFYIIDNYRINRTYVDNLLKEVKLNKSIDKKINYLKKINFRFDRKIIKLYLKKIYILSCLKLKKLRV